MTGEAVTWEAEEDEEAAAAAAAAAACACRSECIAPAVGERDMGEVGAALDEMPLPPLPPLLLVPPGTLKLDDGEEVVETDDDRTDRDGLVAAALLLAADPAMEEGFCTC